MDLPEMGDEVVNEDMRINYPELHVTTLLNESNPHFVGIPSRGIESVMQHLSQVPKETF
jgi:hypothetical protein